MSRARTARHALLLPCLVLAACSGLFRSTSKPEQIYYLRAPAGAAAAGSGAGGEAAASHATALPASLRVGHVEAGPGLDTPHIMLVQADHRMNFYTGTRWPVPAPQLIEALAVQTLRTSGQWRSVEDAGSSFPSDYLVQMHLTRFEGDYSAGADAPVVHVVLDCILGRREGREVLATFTVSGSAAAAANHQSAVVAAFEQATGTALEALARQAAQAVSLDLQHSAAAPDTPPPARP